MPTNIRPLHFVFKIGNRTKTISFYRSLLGMNVLRHEEFTEGCNAACNGPYDGKWSKTMVGYGDEHTNFVVELTYNYGIREYARGNDFDGLVVQSSAAVQRIRAQSEYAYKETGDGYLEIFDPSGYRFLVGLGDSKQDNVISGVRLFVSDLDKSKTYWNGLLKAGVRPTSNEEHLDLSFDNLCYFTLRLVASTPKNAKIEHGKAYGRIAFSCPTDELKPLQSQVVQAHGTILTPYIQLDTPGKATVSVVILADPDGHEICFVGDFEFRDLSQVDPKAQQLLDEAIANDKSDEWHEKKKKKASN